MLAMVLWLSLWLPGVQVGVGAEKLNSSRRPDSLKFEIRATRWQGYPNVPASETDTLVAMARAGDYLDNARTMDGWRPHSLGAPFTLERIVTHDRAWVSFTSEVVASVPVGGESPGFASDSVLISTVWRSFGTPSFDAGVSYRIRIIPDRHPEQPDGDGPAQISVTGREVIGSKERDRFIMATELVGLFRLQAIARDSVRFVGDPTRTTELTVRAQEIWKGFATREGDEITVLAEGGVSSDTSWVAPRSTPIRRGSLVLLFLERRHQQPWQGRWAFSPFGLGLFDRSERLVFSQFGRGVPVGQMREMVDQANWPMSHPYLGRVVGKVMHADSSQPAQGLRISTQESPVAATTDARGWFELRGIPIGIDWLRVTSPRGTASGLIEVSDEFTDTIGVRLPF